VVGALAIGAAAHAQPSGADEQATWNRWALNCQGCHRPDGSGSPGGAPPMRGVVASFLKVEGGRTYLTRVPGVATAPLRDNELADVLNFVLRRFDGERLPADFKPFTAAEIAAGRKAVLRTEAASTRRQLMARIAVANTR
jgi:mono/diheme cytochrome c family protein